MCPLVNQIEKDLEKQKISFLSVIMTIVIEKRHQKKQECIYNHMCIFMHAYIYRSGSNS